MLVLMAALLKRYTEKPEPGREMSAKYYIHIRATAVLRIVTLEKSTLDVSI